MFHLVFDGNIGRLSTATLKRHLEPITNCAAPYLELYLRGRRLRDLDTGTQVGFQDGVVLDLRIAKSASSHDGTVPKPDVSSGRTGIRHYPLSTRGNAPPARASPSEHPRRSKYRFQSTGRHNASWRGSGSESSSDGVECLFIEDEGGDSEGDEVIANESFNTRRHHSVQHVLPSQSHPSGTQQSRSLELKDDLNWLIENKRFETERMLKEFKLRRHETLLAQQAAMLEKEFEEVQRVLTYENLRGDLIQREVRKSRELEALRRPQWGGIR